MVRVFKLSLHKTSLRPNVIIYWVRTSPSCKYRCASVLCKVATIPQGRFRTILHGSCRGSRGTPELPGRRSLSPVDSRAKGNTDVPIRLRTSPLPSAGTTQLHEP